MDRYEFLFLFILYLNICLHFFKKKYLLTLHCLKFCQNKNVLYNKRKKLKYLILFKILFKIKNLKWHLRRYVNFYTNFYSKTCDLCLKTFFLEKKIHLLIEFKHTKRWISYFLFFLKKNFQKKTNRNTCIRSNTLIYEKKYTTNKKKKDTLSLFRKDRLFRYKSNPAFLLFQKKKFKFIKHQHLVGFV
nr:hypothetical protein CparaKRNrm2_p040 [Cryptomonas paramecium]